MPITFIAAAAGVPAEIHIYDHVGWDVTARDFAASLQALGDVPQINVRINSPGGNVFDGIAIYNMLLRHPARIVVDVDGLAASIATVIAMAGDEIKMASNAMWMIHNAEGGAYGGAGDLRRCADLLDTIGQIIVDTYCRRTGQSRATVAQWMDAETWMTAEQARAHGFVDALSGPVQIAARWAPPKFQNVPPEFRAVLAAARPLSPQQEIDMLDKQLAAALGLAPDADAAAAVAAVNALKTARPPAQPDPAQYAPVAVVAELQAQVAALTAAATKAQHTELLNQGLADGRILPALRDWAEKMPLDGLRDYLASAQPVAALVGTQTAGRTPPPAGGVDVNATAQAAQAYVDEQRKAGRAVTYAQAVGHVLKGGGK